MTRLSGIEDYEAFEAFAQSLNHNPTSMTLIPQCIRQNVVVSPMEMMMLKPKFMKNIHAWVQENGGLEFSKLPPKPKKPLPPEETDRDCKEVVLDHLLRPALHTFLESLKSLPETSLSLWLTVPWQPSQDLLTFMDVLSQDLRGRAFLFTTSSMIETRSKEDATISAAFSL